MKIKRESYKPITDESFPTPNGNFKRNHKENVKRRKLRRLKNKAK